MIRNFQNNSDVLKLRFQKVAIEVFILENIVTISSYKVAIWLLS